MRLVTLSLRCHNSQEDAPDHEAADAEYPVAPIFRHVANMACSPCRQTPGADQRLERGSTALIPRERLDLRLNVASSPVERNRDPACGLGYSDPSHDVQLVQLVVALLT